MSQVIASLSHYTPERAFVETLSLGDDVLSIEYLLVANNYGVLIFEMKDAPSAMRLKPWSRIEIELQLSRTSTPWVEGQTCFFVRKRSRTTDENGVVVWKFTAYSAIYLLRTRIIPAQSGTAEALKNGAADDLMKAYVRENIGSSAASDRDLSDHIDVEADYSAAVVTDYDGTWTQYLLDALIDLANSTKSDGTPIYFDLIVQGAGGKLIFITKAGQLGTDRTPPNGATLSTGNGHLRSIEIEEDYTDEVTVAYATGRGFKEEREYRSWEDEDRMAESIFSRMEALASGAMIDTDPDALLTAAKAAVAAGSPATIITAEINNDAAFMYGRDWFHGDRLSIHDSAIEYTGMVGATRVWITPSGFTAQAIIRGERVVAYPTIVWEEGQNPTLAADSGSGAYHGIHGGEVIQRGRLGAIYARGRSQYTSLSAFATASPVAISDITIYLEAKLIDDTPVSVQEYLLSLGNVIASPNNFGLQIVQFGTNVIRFRVNVGGVFTAYLHPLTSVKSWHSYSLAHSDTTSAATIKACVDGSNVWSTPALGAGLSPISPSATAINSTTSSSFSTGGSAFIRNVIVGYKVAASNANISTIHSQSQSGALSTTTLDTIFGSSQWSWWKLDEI